jgi:hypothetical protein
MQTAQRTFCSCSQACACGCLCSSLYRRGDHGISCSPFTRRAIHFLLQENKIKFFRCLRCQTEASSFLRFTGRIFASTQQQVRCLAALTIVILMVIIVPSPPAPSWNPPPLYPSHDRLYLAAPMRSFVLPHGTPTNGLDRKWAN